MRAKAASLQVISTASTCWVYSTYLFSCVLHWGPATGVLQHTLMMQDMRFRLELKWNLRRMVTFSGWPPSLGLLSSPLSLSCVQPAGRRCSRNQCQGSLRCPQLLQRCTILQISLSIRRCPWPAATAEQSSCTMSELPDLMSRLPESAGKQALI